MFHGKIGGSADLPQKMRPFAVMLLVGHQPRATISSQLSKPEDFADGYFDADYSRHYCRRGLMGDRDL
jgi:hypothetical protein